MTDDRIDPATAPDDDAELRALMRAAGARPAPPAELSDQVRAAVAAEWRAVVAARRPQRRTGPWLVAASAAAVAVGAWFALAPRVDPDAVAATVIRPAPSAEVRDESSASWRTLSAGTELRAGDRVRTQSTGGVVVRRVDGLEVRLDAATVLAFDDVDHARLETGRVYVDAGGTHERTDAFVVQTGLGTVRHLGTQYAVSVAPATMAVAVREGSVAIERGRSDAVANAGESITVRADGRMERTPLAPHDASWQWAEAAAPAFAIDGRTLDDFLAWAARETGRRLVYDSPATARAAEQTVLKGSVDGLAPMQALDAVLTTTPALRHRVAAGQLRIELAKPDGMSP